MRPVARFSPVLLLLPLLLSACSDPGAKTMSATTSTRQENLMIEPLEPPEPSREALFVYQQNHVPEGEIVLKLNAEPLLLGAGYVRLAGVVRGRNPLALIEAGGRGLCLELGDRFQGYCLSEVALREVRLIKEEGK